MITCAPTRFLVREFAAFAGDAGLPTHDKSKEGECNAA
jgi:hypothetical protein